MKPFDKFIDVFVLVLDIFFCSLIFPFSIGVIILILHPMAVWLTEQGVLVYIVGIILGLLFRKWRDRRE